MGVMTERTADDIQLTEKEIERREVVEKKKKENDFQVAFCGHFSAGKSTILNFLLGAEMLPTSPIPTSANIIGIKNGELGLTVHNTDGKSSHWDGEIPWEKVREWGMDGGGISSIIIEAPLPFLGEKSIIYDTPGVDSTDPTHQAVTMEALYATDFIVYCMEYNHVQSETNLNFLKQLSDEKKPLYLVINQIDKHDESELSFESFDQSVRHTFQEWGINILKLCYTSMKVQDHPLSEVHTFEQDMKAMLYHGDDLLPYARQRLQQGYYLSIASRLEEEKEAEIDDIKEQLKEAGFRLEQLEEREAVAKELSQFEHAQSLFEERIEREIQKITNDVTIFPYTTTELTRHWLDSMQPNFKVGLLFTKKKTEEEQRARLEKLLEEVKDKIKSQLEFHLYRLFQAEDFTKLTNREEVERALEQLVFHVEAPFFVDAVQAGPKNREYVYTYTKDRTQAIVRELRQKAATVRHLMCDGFALHWEKQKQEAKDRLLQLNQLDGYASSIEAVRNTYDESISTMQSRAGQFQDAGGYERAIGDAMNKNIPTFEVSDHFAAISLPEETVIDTDWTARTNGRALSFNEREANEWVSQLKNGLESFATDERMNLERQSLLNRVNKYEQQTFTISLFGAFSAGKSSFANALLGDQILPVSPHPTTATVNTVKRSEVGFESKTAMVKVKTYDQLNKEIQAVAEQLDLSLTIDSLSSWKPNKQEAVTSWQKTYQAYLLTLKNSLHDTTWELGSQFKVTLEELQPYVANEHDACLINEVILYYDCPLTEKGIVLVDTPGVNSIHGRHTNVAFKQVRDSDAIFYVSYYNHAFSKADQSFLQQIAKVNDGFRSDKLYFVLNAADLASSPFELNGVRKHVLDQLVQCGIDEPRLYPLSSKKGLQGKLEGKVVDEMFATFERDFYEQTIAELQRLSYELLRDEARLYETVLSEGLEYALGAEETKLEKREQLASAVVQQVERLREEQPLSAYQLASQEVSQLFLYLRERIRYVLGDNFVESVNVTTVVGASKRSQQQALLLALQEWRSEGEHFLTQEIQATFVRVELALMRSITEWIGETVQGLREQFPAYTNAFEAEKKELSLSIPTRLLPLELESYASTLQSLKSFFEQQQSKKLREDVVTRGAELANEQLKAIEESMMGQLNDMFQDTITLAKESLRESLDRELERFDALMDPKHHASLQEEYNVIHEILHKL